MVEKKERDSVDKPCLLAIVFCAFTGATATEGLLDGRLTVLFGSALLDCVSFFFG